jgi:arabinogalactan oligomer/maltooligosaccharide transport system permease protein
MLKVKRSTIAAYLTPMFIVIALITLYPIIYTIYLSFTNKSLFGHFFNFDFIGLQNYTKLITDVHSDFYFVTLLTILYVVACVATFLIVGVTTALALNNQKIRWLPLWRVILIVPWAVPSIITALIWRFLFQDPFGPFDQILVLLFGHGHDYDFLHQPVSAFIAVVVINLWLSFPAYSIITLGALQSIPQELYEAASVDGATAWQRFRRITLPLLRPALTPYTILNAIFTFQMFNTVFLVTQGGPYASATSRGATEFVLIYVYDKIFGSTAGNVKYGFIAAYSVLIFLVLLAATILTLRATNLIQPEEGPRRPSLLKRLLARGSGRVAQEVQA